MAMSNAEKVRAYRERQKEKRKLELRQPGESADEILKEPFSGFYQANGNSDGFEIPLLLTGMQPPAFVDDSEAVFPDDLDGLEVPTVTNSIERAEMTVGCLLDAASALAEIVNSYKRKEITDRIHEIETSDLSDARVRQQVLADIVRLKKMLDQLDKQVRHTLPQWKVTVD